MNKRFLELFAQGYKRATNADLRGANELYEEALHVLGDTDHPQLTGLLANIAQNALRLGELDKGWLYFDRALTRALETDRKQALHPNTWHQFAWILYERGEVAHAAQALELVDRALLSDDRLETHDTRMRILLKLEREAEARKVAVVALQRDFNHPDFQDIKERWGLTRMESVAPVRSEPARAPKPRKVRPPRTVPRPRPLPTPRPDPAPRPKQITELGEWKGQPIPGKPVRHRAEREPQLDLTLGGRAKTPRRRAQELLRRHLSSSHFLREQPTPILRRHLIDIAGDLIRGPYAHVDAALGLALLNDRLAIPVLRRVLIEPMFAVTNSLHEQGFAALGLALLGDTTQLPRIRLCPRINLNAVTVELAINILEALAYPEQS